MKLKDWEILIGVVASLGLVLLTQESEPELWVHYYKSEKEKEMMILSKSPGVPYEKTWLPLYNISHIGLKLLNHFLGLK